ncbi:MAG: T9SS type A sorting domain-containing protein, partial [Ignavibacteria bacterium]
DVVIVYDSTLANCRISRDSISNNLGVMGITYDLYNRKGNTATNSISYRGYKKVILLGEATSVMSNVIKDSLKSYIAAGTSSIKSKVIMISEDIGYHLDRAASTYIDTSFARGTLGFQFVLDRPTSGANQGLIGVTTNPNMADSTTGPWPDVLRRPDGVPSTQSFRLYRFRAYPDSSNGIGRITATYNVAVLGVDIESLKPTSDSPPGSPVRRFLKGALDFVDGFLVSVQPNIVNGIPTVYSLAQNYPNPFNPTTKISFSIPKNGMVSLKIYDVLGKEVMTLVNEHRSIGNYDVTFDGSNLSSGAYFYRLEAGEFTDIRRMVLIK